MIESKPMRWSSVTMKRMFGASRLAAPGLTAAGLVGAGLRDVSAGPDEPEMQATSASAHPMASGAIGRLIDETLGAHRRGATVRRRGPSGSSVTGRSTWRRRVELVEGALLGALVVAPAQEGGGVAEAPRGVHLRPARLGAAT